MLISSMLQQSELIFDFASDHFAAMPQLGGHSDYPAVIVEQVPHPHLLSYTGLACEQSQDLQAGQLKGGGQALGETQKQA
uniref:ETS-related transcription factor Elf-1-like n=1 Tax=Acanthochromis polyacanthus TaxID=80966 RepID=A0A3Q1FKJ9_9TELE